MMVGVERVLEYVEDTPLEEDDDKEVQDDAVPVSYEGNQRFLDATTHLDKSSVRPSVLG